MTEKRCGIIYNMEKASVLWVDLEMTGLDIARMLGKAIEVGIKNAEKFEDVK